MGNFEVMREAFTQAKDYQRQWDEYNEKVKKGDKNATAPKKDLKLDALVQVLQGKMLVQIHCYRADEFLTEIAIANEFGYKIRAFHHALEAYKVPEALAQNDIAIATFADWWGFKYEAWDAIPWNAVMAMRAGVSVAIKSDSDDYMRRLNQEAAKTMRYGGATEDEAMKMITLNPAWIIGVDDKTAPSTSAKTPTSCSGTAIRSPATAFRRRSGSTATCTLIASCRGWACRSSRRGSDDESSRCARCYSSLRCCCALAAIAQQKPAPVEGGAPPSPTRSEQAHRHHGRQAADHHPWHHRERRAGHRERKDHRRRCGGIGEGSRRAQVIDAKGMTVYPGLIDSESHLGLTEIRPTRMTNDLVEPSDEIMPHMHVADAFHAESELIPVTRYNGITNAIVAPESRRHPARPGLVHPAGRVPTPPRCC